MKKTLAFDIDGTLLNKQGELDKNVYPIFAHPRFADCNVIFCTGNSLKIADALMYQIKTLFPHLHNLKAYCASRNGSIIHSPSKIEIINKSLDKTSVLQDIQIFRQYDPKGVIFVSNLNDNYASIPSDLTIYNELIAFQQHEQKKGDIGMNIIILPQNEQQIVQDVNKICGIFAITPQHNAILKYLSEKYKDSPYGIYYDAHYNLIQLTSSTKWQSLQDIIAYQKNIGNPDDYPDNAKEIIYFGDGHNDIECLQKCDLSYARGSNLAPEIATSAKYYVTDLTDVATKIFG